MTVPSLYNGHFGYTCYHPLFVFTQFGDMERALLRNGNVSRSDDWKSVLEPIIERYRDNDIIRYFRGDAAFANPDIYRLLDTENYFYAIRLKGNNILYDHIEHTNWLWLMIRIAEKPGFQAGTLVEVRQRNDN